MDTYVASIFTDAQAEFTNTQSASPSIDFLDSALTPSLVPTFTSSPNFQVTSASSGGFGEIEFLLPNNFWGVNFNFGNDPNGIQVRQGIWHLIDTASFAANQPTLQGRAQAADNPEPTADGGLLPANPCSWDSSFPESGPNCIVGAPGGTAYHLGPSGAGAGGFTWNQPPGSADMNAAAQHFVNAGVATGFNPTTSVLTGISAGAAAHPVSFFIRNDNPALLDLGNSLSEQICYLFTGSYSVPCSYLSLTRGPITAFPGLTTSSTNVNLNWGLYTSGISPSGQIDDPGVDGFDMKVHLPDGDPFDGTLYFWFNSNFVNGNPNIVACTGSPIGCCSPSSLHGGFSSANYMYLCNQAYDSISAQMEFAKCMTVSGDPISGSTSNNSTGTCSGGGLSAIGAGIETENAFGKYAYTIPVYAETNQFGYLNDGFARVVNSMGGLTNFFTFLSTFNPSAPAPGTIRQGLFQTTVSVNPYVAATALDALILGNIFDSLVLEVPLSPGTSNNLIDWMVLSVQQLPNTSLTYSPPAGTVQTFRFTLRSDMFFQDGEKVTSFDVAFSYLSLLATGSFQGGGLEPMTGVTILGASQFDINLNAVGPFTLQAFSGTTIVPGREWNGVGTSLWTNTEGNCLGGTATCYPAQYTLRPASGSGMIPQVSCSLNCGFDPKFMNVAADHVAAGFDPIKSQILIGSGPWKCDSSDGTNLGSGCSLTENPPAGGSYVLHRFGKGLAPGSSISSIYFRSNGNLAAYLWSLDTGDITHDFLNFSTVASCYGAAITSTGPCAHFQQGIGANGGPTPVGLGQVAIVNRFVGLNWIAPFNWSTSAPLGIIPLNPVLYENTVTLSPASGTGGVGCTNPYPAGGYDC